MRNKSIGGAITEVKDKTEITRACLLHAGIIEASGVIAWHVLKLGEFFKEMKDTKLYTYLGCDIWDDYIALPEIPLKRSSIYDYMRLSELYRHKLNLPEQYLSIIGQYKLLVIAPVVEENPEEWLGKAKVLSRADLINEVREAKGKEPMPPRAKSSTLDVSTGYLDYVKSHPCIFHDDRKSENAHFPRTKARGGQEDEVIPLCHECHSICDNNGVVTFFDNYRNQIMGYFYDLLRQLYERLNQ